MNAAGKEFQRNKGPENEGQEREVKGREVGGCRILLMENYRQTLTVARSLRRAGYVLTGGIPEVTPSAFDRAVAASAALHATWTHPPFNSSRFIPALTAFCQERAIDAIFPVGEVSLPMLSAHGGSLPPLVAPSADISARCLNKAAAAELAREAGLPVPEGQAALEADEIRQAIQAVGLPCVVKSKDGLRQLLGRKAWVLQEEPSGELLARMAGHGVVVQRFIEGRRVNCMFLALQGRLTAYFEQEVLRTDQADGTGVATVERSITPTPALQGLVERLAAHLRYDGPGCAQFFLNAGGPCFLELNPRLDANVALAVHCGVDFPALAVEARLAPDKAARRSLLPYREGRRLGSWLADFEGSLQALVSRQSGISAVVGWQARALKDALLADCATVGDWRDPRPAFVLAQHLAGAIGRRLTGRSQKTSPAA